MPVDIIVAARDYGEKNRRLALAQLVMSLVDVPTPDQRALCFLDNEDCRYLKSVTRGVNRGYHADDPDREIHSYVRDRLDALGESQRENYKSLVYLHGTTCSTDVGLCMTLAHEFQHLKQSIGIVPEYVVCRLIGKCNEIVREHALIWSDIPHEREARIVSKRVATTALGTEAVRTYVDREISDAVSKMKAASTEEDEEAWSNDAADWLFIRRVSTDLEYDFVRETRLLYPALCRFQGPLEETQRLFSDLGGVDLATLFSGDASAYVAAPPMRGEFSCDEEPIIWEGDGWDHLAHKALWL
jgi:hypothetical protein